MQYHIVSFSGGKDSTALLLKMIESGMQIDEIICCDTGVEFPEMYRHIERVKKYIDLPITTLKSEHTFEYLMFEYEKTKGKGKGDKGYSWPDFKNRWCTYLLKQQLINRHLRRYNNAIEYHGITTDEAYRADKNQDGRNIQYPLIDWKMTGQDCLNYCYDKGFRWDGLYDKFNRVSCYLCPLQRIGELKILYTHYPELWEQMKRLDKKSIEQFNRQFTDRYSIEELENRFYQESLQISIWGD